MQSKEVEHLRENEAREKETLHEKYRIENENSKLVEDLVKQIESQQMQIQSQLAEIQQLKNKALVSDR